MPTEATEAHFFTLESSSTNRFSVPFPSDGVGPTQFLWKRTQILCVQLNFCGNELNSCESNSIPVQKGEPPWSL